MEHDGRPNFELVELGDGDYQLVARDGSIAGRVTPGDVDRVRAMLDDPMAIFAELERRLADDGHAAG